MHSPKNYFYSATENHTTIVISKTQEVLLHYCFIQEQIQIKEIHGKANVSHNFLSHFLEVSQAFLAESQASSSSSIFWNNPGIVFLHLSQIGGSTQLK